MFEIKQSLRNPSYFLSLALAFAVVQILGIGQAEAQYSVPSRASSSKKKSKSKRPPPSPSQDSDDRRETMTTGEMVMPDPEKDELLPWEIGVSLNFITSEPSLGGEKLEFTDLMLLRLHTLFSFSSFDLFAGADILPKQPSYSDEHPWQGALMGVRTTFADNFSAWTRAQGGPLLGRNGYWAGGDLAVEHHLDLQKFLFVDTSLGFSHTHLLYDEDDGNNYMSDEVFTRIGLSVRDPKRGLFATWLNFDYYYPVHGSPDAIDPQPRVNMRLGALGAVSKSVDLFIEFSILDRGDLEDLRTTLPILNGGFDQQTLIMGFMRHFGPERSFY